MAKRKKNAMTYVIIDVIQALLMQPCVLCIPYRKLTISYYFAGLVIGDSCRYDSDCFVEQSYCHMQQICECKENFLPTSDHQYCVASEQTRCYSYFLL